MGYCNNFVVYPYFDINPVDWEGLLASLSILLTVSGARDYGIYASERKADEKSEAKPEKSQEPAAENSEAQV